MQGVKFQNSQSSGTDGHSASHDLPNHNTRLAHSCLVYKLHTNISPVHTSNAKKSRLFQNKGGHGNKIFVSGTVRIQISLAIPATVVQAFLVFVSTFRKMIGTLSNCAMMLPPKFSTSHS
jgi:hypothetical protein